MSKRIQRSDIAGYTGAQSDLGDGRAPVSSDCRPISSFWLGFAFLCLLTTFLINNPFWRASGEQPYKEGDIARESIISPADIYFSRRRRRPRGSSTTARETIKPIFRFESKRAGRGGAELPSAWENLQRQGFGANAANRTTRTQRAKPNGRARAARSSAKFSRPATSAATSSMRLPAYCAKMRAAISTATRTNIIFENEISVIDRQKPNQLARGQNAR